MTGLESQEEDTSNRVLFFKPMSWLGQISPHRRNESWSPSLWQTNLYRPFGCQEDSRLGGWSTCWPFYIELVGYLPNVTGPVSLVLDLRVAHDRVGSRTDSDLNGHLRYPNNLDQSLNEFYSYRLIGKLTAFLQFQEFCQHNQIVDSSTTTERFFLLCSSLGLEIFSSSLQLYVLTLT